MKGTMRSAVAHALRAPLAIEHLPIPSPGPGELLVKIRASGVCHTDLHAVQGDWPIKPGLPFIPGHEGAGVVAEVDADVKHLRSGDPVGIAWLHDACGHCEYCVSGWETLCERQRNSGYSVNGTFSEYAIARADYAARLPAGCDFVALAPILCAGVTSYKGIRETEARPGEWIVISGVGGLGHLAIQYAQAMGLHVAAIDVSESKLELARSLGAEIVVNAADAGALEEVRRGTGGGAQGVLVTAVSPGAVTQALGMVRRKGTISLVGLPPGELVTPIFDVVLKRITLRGSIVGNRQDLAEAIAMAADGKVQATVEPYPLDQVNAVLDKLRAGTIEGRAVLDMSLMS